MASAMGFIVVVKTVDDFVCFLQPHIAGGVFKNDTKLSDRVNSFQVPAKIWRGVCQ